MAIKTHLTERVSVGHNNAEFYIRLGDFVLILPPAAAKILVQKLAALPAPANEKTIAGRKKSKKQESIAKQVLKALYKGKMVTKSLIAINTKRKKRLPDI